MTSAIRERLGRDSEASEQPRTRRFQPVANPGGGIGHDDEVVQALRVSESWSSKPRRPVKPGLRACVKTRTLNFSVVQKSA